jgi:septum formation protein
MADQLILASGSARRYELLKSVGLDFDIIPSGITEDFIPEESPEEYVIRLAGAKAREVGTRNPHRWVIAADTVVCVGRSMLGKPKNRGEAMEMLGRLSGSEHWVVTGFSVNHLGKGIGEWEAVRTAVKVKALSTSEKEWYVRSGEPFDKAGGYAIQGIGSFMIESIRGSYTNVVGLPLCEAIQMLTRLGAITFPPPPPKL